MTHPDTPTSSVLDQLGELWQRSKPTALSRIDSLRAAAGSTAGASGEDEVLAEATTAAHKLAGTLGMFGLGESSAVAERTNQLVERTGLRTSADRAALAGLVERLRELVEAER